MGRQRYSEKLKTAANKMGTIGSLNHLKTLFVGKVMKESKLSKKLFHGKFVFQKDTNKSNKEKSVAVPPSSPPFLER
jgi:hypothetical protein